MWLPIYDCPVCGETWRIKSKLSESNTQFVCIDCGSVILKQKYNKIGTPLCHLITDAELEEEDKKDGVTTSLDESYLDDDDLNYIPDYYYDD